MHNQTVVTETDGSITTYAYDGMARVTEMRYPNGWVEYYTYDKMGRLLSVDDTHPSEKPAKTQKHTYDYDANGNLVHEYMRGNGTGQAKNDTTYTYDALNRLVTAHDNYGNSTRTYTYDTLGNLTYETGNGSHNTDYRYNNLNQEVERSADGWKTYTTSSYDKRGNLILETYYKNKKAETAGEYTFDETNKMVEGVNANGEQSIYSYNGLGALMENTWIIAKNGYGYHDVSATAVVDGEVVVDVDTGKRQQKVRLTPEELEAANAAEDAAIAAAAAEVEKAEEAAASDDETEAEVDNPPMLLAAGNQVNGNDTQDKPTGSDVKKTSTVVKEFVVDFSREDYKPLMEHEVNGLTYRYVNSDKARLSVVVQGIETGSSSLLDEKGELHAYYHTDYLGTTDYLTSAVNSKVISWTSYNEWGEITHNAVLKCGKRELDLVKEYATHDYDAVLDLYYAKARFYDAYNRTFTAQDPILDSSQYDLREYVKEPMALVQYLYVADNAIIFVDILGKVRINNRQLYGVITGTDLGSSSAEAYLYADEVLAHLVMSGVAVDSSKPRGPELKTGGYQSGNQNYYRIVVKSNGRSKHFDLKAQVGTVTKYDSSGNRSFQRGYFISLSCVQDLAAQLGLNWSFTQTNQMFRSADFTSEAGKIAAAELIWNKFLYGSAVDYGGALGSKRELDYIDYSYLGYYIAMSYVKANAFKNDPMILEAIAKYSGAAAAAGATAATYPAVMIPTPIGPIPLQGIAFAGHLIINAVASQEDGVMPASPSTNAEAATGIFSNLAPELGAAFDEWFKGKQGEQAEIAAAQLIAFANSDYLFLLKDSQVAKYFASDLELSSNLDIRDTAGLFTSFIPNYMNAYTEMVEDVVELNRNWSNSKSAMESYINANYEQYLGELSQDVILSWELT